MPKIGLNHKIAVCLVNKVNNKRTGREKINFYDCNCYEYFHFHGNFVCDILSAKTLTCDTRSISFAWVKIHRVRRRLSKHVRQIKRTIHHFLLSSLLIAAVSSVVVVKCRILHPWWRQWGGKLKYASCRKFKFMRHFKNTHYWWPWITQFELKII